MSLGRCLEVFLRFLSIHLWLYDHDRFADILCSQGWFYIHFIIVLDAGQILTDQVKGVELMRKLGIKSNERKSVESLVDFNLNKDNIYEAMKEQAVLFLKTGKREEIKDDKTVDNDAKKANPKKPAKQQGNQPKEAQNMMKGQSFQQGPARINNNPHFNQGQYPPGQSNPGFQASRYPNYQTPFNLNPYQQANFNQHVQGQQHGFQYLGTFQPGAYPRFSGNMGPQSNKSTNQNTGKQGGPQPGNSRPGPRNSRHPNQPGNEGGKGGANQNTGNQKGDDKNGGPSKNRKQRGKSVAPDQNNSASEGKDGDGQKSTIVVHVHNVTK